MKTSGVPQEDFTCATNSLTLVFLVSQCVF
jgi:hypothetical protein